MHPPDFLAEPKRAAEGTLVGEKLFRTNSGQVPIDKQDE